MALAGLAVWSIGVRQTPHAATIPAAARPATETRVAPKDPAPVAEQAVGATNNDHAITTTAVVKGEPKRTLSIESLPMATEPDPVKRSARVAKPAAPKAAPSETVAAADTNNVPAAATETAAAPATPATPAASTAPVKEGLDPGDFNKDAARQALDDAGQRASTCRTVDAPGGVARVAVTFAPTGTVTAAVVESGPLVGTSAGSCVASKFRTAKVPVFTGDPITVHKSFSF